MMKMLKIVTSDGAKVVTGCLTGVFLLSGFVSCIALGMLVAHVTLMAPVLGMHYFRIIMELRGTGLAEPIRESLAIINYVSLLTLFIMMLGAVRDYLVTAARRAHRGSVVSFPAASNHGPTLKNVVNL